MISIATRGQEITVQQAAELSEAYEEPDADEVRQLLGLARGGRRPLIA